MRPRSHPSMVLVTLRPCGTPRHIWASRKAADKLLSKPFPVSYRNERKQEVMNGHEEEFRDRHTRNFLLREETRRVQYVTRVEGQGEVIERHDHDSLPEAWQEYRRLCALAYLAWHRADGQLGTGQLKVLLVRSDGSPLRVFKPTDPPARVNGAA